MRPISFSVGDRIQMKKKHPCSSDVFTILRVGSDVRVICNGCGRDLTFPRESIEKMVKRVVSSGS
ncbi:MAG: DUF951 domain-containing protein [Clostridia bacterium]|nr:DUF951 domain-containing protein [Clostridia bacterium]